MAGSGRARDIQLLDAIDALTPKPFEGSLWRVVREGRDPLVCSAVGGRWDDRTFDVLYTSKKSEGAIAEMYFHVTRGQPVIPSKVKYILFELAAQIPRCIELPTLRDLERLGLRTEQYGQLSHFERTQEYPRTQEIAEVAYFLGHDGLIVPSARYATENVIVYCDRVPPENLAVTRSHGFVDWPRR
jgi:RES domain-containing protein